MWVDRKKEHHINKLNARQLPNSYCLLNWIRKCSYHLIERYAFAKVIFIIYLRYPPRLNQGHNSSMESLSELMQFILFIDRLLSAICNYRSKQQLASLLRHQIGIERSENNHPRSASSDDYKQFRLRNSYDNFSSALS